MGTLSHIFLSGMSFLGRWSWQSTAWRPSVSQKGHEVPELPGLRHSHRAASETRMGRLRGAALSYLGWLSSAALDRGLGTFSTGRLGAKVRLLRHQGALWLPKQDSGAQPPPILRVGLPKGHRYLVRIYHQAAGLPALEEFTCQKGKVCYSQVKGGGGRGQGCTVYDGELGPDPSLAV